MRQGKFAIGRKATPGLLPTTGRRCRRNPSGGAQFTGCTSEMERRTKEKPQKMHPTYKKTTKNASFVR
jgi:hypothetical protein